MSARQAAEALFAPKTVLTEQPATRSFGMGCASCIRVPAAAAVPEACRPSQHLLRLATILAPGFLRENNEE
jgi:hypothetical protein